MTSTRRAVGIIRVSQPRDRSGESFHSPEDQRALIERYCADREWDPIACHPEMHVSGDAPLERRPGLSQAMTALLTDHADVIVGDSADRLWWSREVRARKPPGRKSIRPTAGA